MIGLFLWDFTKKDWYNSKVTLGNVKIALASEVSESLLVNLYHVPLIYIFSN